MACAIVLRGGSEPESDLATEPFNLDQMRMIATAAAEGSFTRAAAVLGITQSAVSQGVRAVEEALGRQLLLRGPRGLAVTPDGEAYLVYAQAMSKVGADARRHFTAAPCAGTIRLGLKEDLARTMLPSVLALFSRQHPGFSFEVECGLSTMLFAGFGEGRFQAVIVKQPVSRSVDERLWVEPLAWYGRPDTPHPVLDPLDLALFPQHSETRETMLNALRAAGRPWRVMFQSLSYATLEAAVLAGIGITALGRHLHGPGLVELGDDSGLPPLPPLDVVMRQTARGRDSAVDAFCDLIREVAILSSEPAIGQTSAMMDASDPVTFSRP